ncbi:hypothetical protein NX059_003565 [Plenodomus lindquistii]|nr:hypothetical protein NX059_003565 [Plenodomus lindquistii]
MNQAPLLLSMLTALGSALYDFSPDNSPTVYDHNLATQISLPATQVVAEGFNSYWLSHFLTTGNDTQFVVISHAVVLPTNQITIRSSVLDVGNPEIFWMSSTTVPLQGNATSINGQLSIKGEGFELSSNSEDNLASIVSAGSTDYYKYNLTVKASSRVILNAGTGIFNWGKSRTTQWSLPSAQTSGTLSIGDSLYQVNGERSMTWYDRQYGDGGPDGGFTWFGIHFPGSNVKASIWHSDHSDPEQHLRFATVRTDYGLTIVRFKATADPNEAWTSPTTNVTYQTKWFLEFDNGDFLEVTSVRKDQEIPADGLFVASAFATVKGQFFGHKKGFALVDVVPAV